MDYMPIVTSNQTGEYIQKIFGNSINPADFLFLSILALIIGFLAITIRYVLNPKDESEYKKWKDENWLTKIILSLMIGALSFITIELLIEFINVLGIAFLDSKVPVTSDYIGETLFGKILFTAVYATGILYTLGKRGYNYYKDLSKFSFFHLFTPLIIVTLSMTILIWAKSTWQNGVIALLFFILVLGITITPFLIPRMNSRTCLWQSST